MFARTAVLSLACSGIFTQVAALDLDTTSQDSIKATTKSLASNIASFYNTSASEIGAVPGNLPRPYYWWEAGIVLNSLISYSHLTGDTQYDSMVSEGLQWQLGVNYAFMPDNQTKVLGNDDQSYWALAALTAAEVGFPKPANGSWEDYAKNVFDLQVLRWDEKTCGGGLKWQIFTFNNGYNYKNMASNGNFFLLAARLAKFTGNATYAEWAEKSYTWARDIGLITEDYHVFDGTDDQQNCSDVNQIQWTYTNGIMVEGAALLYNTSNGNETWKDIAAGFWNASSVFVEDNVLVEKACERNRRCDTDMKAFKGLAARSYARAAVAASFLAPQITPVLEASAKAAADACIDGQDRYEIQCGLVWDGPMGKADAGAGDLSTGFSALEVVQGLLWPGAKSLQTESGSGEDGGNGGSETQNAGANGTSGAAVPEKTGAAGVVVGSVTAVLAVAFAAALSC
jgi:mannan endo-1,6-alpha-mannosidase